MERKTLLSLMRHHNMKHNIRMHSSEQQRCESSEKTKQLTLMTDPHRLDKAVNHCFNEGGFISPDTSTLLKEAAIPSDHQHLTSPDHQRLDSSFHEDDNGTFHNNNNNFNSCDIDDERPLETIKLFDNLQKNADVCLLKLSLRLSQTELELVCDLLNIIHLSHQLKTSNNHLRFPTSYKDFRREFIDGKDSLPVDIKKTIDVQKDEGTATYYIPLFNVIKLHLKFNNDVQYNNTINLVSTLNYWTTPRAKEEVTRVSSLDIHHPFKHLLCLIWSDGFDSNNCKKSRGMSWTQTITLIDNRHKQTYVLALGPDSDDIYKCQKQLFLELNSFSTGKWVENNFIIISLLCYIGDQPERRSICGLALGTSKFHQRWGVLLNHKADGWIPTEASSVGNHLTLKEMQNSINYCFDKHIVRKEWNKTQAKLYLQQKGFSEMIRDKFLALTATDDVCSAVMPPCWLMDIFDVDKKVNVIFPDAPMHLLFLGCTKALYEYLHSHVLDNAKPWNQSSSLIIGKLFNSLEAFKLDWLHILPFTSAVGLLSENYVAICRIMPIVGHVILENERTHYELCYTQYNSMPLANRNSQFYRRHLSLLGETVGGRSEDVKKRCIDEYSMSIDERMKSTVCLCKCLKEMYHVAAHVMQKNYYSNSDHAERTHECCVNLLSSVERYMPGEIVSKYNFLSLLNLSTTMNEVGPLSNIWEGGMIGEKFLTLIKMCINKNGGPWEKACINKVMVHLIGENRCDVLCEQFRHNTNDDFILLRHATTSKRQRKKILRYESIDAIRLLIEQHQVPISGMVVKNKLHILIKDDRVVELYMTSGIGIYFIITVNTFSMIEETNYMADEKKYCILFPVFQNGSQFYNIICDDWRIGLHDDENNTMKFDIIY